MHVVTYKIDSPHQNKCNYKKSLTVSVTNSPQCYFKEVHESVKGNAKVDDLKKGILKMEFYKFFLSTIFFFCIFFLPLYVSTPLASTPRFNFISTILEKHYMDINILKT